MEKEKIKELENKILSSPFAEAQKMINSKASWQADVFVRLSLIEAIRAGGCMFAEEPTIDCKGHCIPSRFEVEPNTIGSPEYVLANLECAIEKYLSCLN